jgi:Restriction endonuclease
LGQAYARVDMPVITNRTPDGWEELEALVADILAEAGLTTQRQLTLRLPRGAVTVDVMVEETIDNIVFRTICECKNWRTNIPQDVVHGFRTVIQESGAHRGYIISRIGFQSGAIEAAKSTNIDLVTFPQFQELYFDKWINKRLWTIEKEVGAINTYYEPFGIPGISRVDDEQHELAYVEVHKKFLFVGCILPLFSPYSRMVRKSPTVALPIDVTGLEKQGVSIPEDLKAATTYREFFELLVGYARTGLTELRAQNPHTRGKQPAELERDD